MTNQVAADLRAAADVLERDGWTQGKYHDNAHFCVVGAIRLAVNGDPVQPSRRSGEVVNALGRVLIEPVYSWNDTPGRTADEVIAALRAAADRAEADQ